MDELYYKIEKQADWISALKYSDLPTSVVHSAKRILLDSIGCISVGLSQIGKEEQLRNPTADVQFELPFFYGTAMVKNELDEGNQFAFGHPGCHIIPAMLAACKNGFYDKETFITSLVGAYEIACRWSAAVKMQPAVHVHGTAATSGSCLAMCRMKGRDAQISKEALMMALSLPQCASWKSAFCGNQVRNAYVGMSNVVGLHAAEMALIGIHSGSDVIQSVWTEILGNNIDEDVLDKDLGEDWLIEKNYFKMHSACRYTHTFADMGLKFLSSGYHPEDINRIHIETYSSAAKLNGKIAENAFAARFSIPVSLAVLLLYGNLDVRTMTDKITTSKDVQFMASKIDVTENPDCTAKLPDIRRSIMKVKLNNGKELIYQQDVTKGDYKDPFSDVQLEDKFKKLSIDVYSKEEQDYIIQTIFSDNMNISMQQLMLW